MIIEEAALKFGVSKTEIHFDGKILKTTDGKKEVSLKELSTELFYNNNQKQLVACESYCGEKSPAPFMGAFTEVEVDTETGKVEVKDYVSIVDCGTTINPNLARIQVEGGLLQGIGMTLYENVVRNEAGKLLTNNLMQYKVPTRKDVTKLTVEFAESYEPSGPYGAKSVGEIGIDTPPAAIANAIFNACGVRVRDLPITPEKLLSEINNLKNKSL
ncbi:putative xanthine dehydrogenase YagR molybdenum-binding subunit [bioreactor metagenome]|uniref:Putative xanthine dehydrogenase YagR molybdenum-binding subunit n=1 Tax=bioreactor metagenome TaxID=1076179 RepID=A0A645END1_9ZZZZ